MSAPRPSPEVVRGVTVAYRARFDECAPDGVVRSSALLRYAQSTQGRGLQHVRIAARPGHDVVFGGETLGAEVERRKSDLRVVDLDGVVAMQVVDQRRLERGKEVEVGETRHTTPLCSTFAVRRRAQVPQRHRRGARRGRCHSPAPERTSPTPRAARPDQTPRRDAHDADRRRARQWRTRPRGQSRSRGDLGNDVDPRHGPTTVMRV